MNMFDLWFRVSAMFSVQFMTKCVKVGPWYVKDEYLVYELNKIDYGVYWVRVYADRYCEVHLYDEDNLHYSTLIHDDIRVLIALTMTMNDTHFEY